MAGRLHRHESEDQPYREPSEAEAADALAGLHRMLGGGFDAAGALLRQLGFTVTGGIDAESHRPFILAFS